MIEKTLRLAIEAGYSVKMVYLKEATPQMRHLKPRTLEKGVLVAMDYDRQQVRRFSLSKILAVELIREEA